MEEIEKKYKLSFSIKWVYLFSLVVLVFLSEISFFSSKINTVLLYYLLLFLSLGVIIASFSTSFYFNKLTRNKKNPKDIFPLFFALVFIVLLIIFYKGGLLSPASLKEISIFFEGLSLFSLGLNEIYKFA
jgi:hypothetical protein